MRGVRCKELRDQFFRDHGHYPMRTQRTEVRRSRSGFLFDAGIFKKSEWRRLKKDYQLGRRNP